MNNLHTLNIGFASCSADLEPDIYLKGKVACCMHLGLFLVPMKACRHCGLSGPSHVEGHVNIDFFIGTGDISVDSQDMFSGEMGLWQEN
jgi:hypothetical protein